MDRKTLPVVLVQELARMKIASRAALLGRASLLLAAAVLLPAIFPGFPGCAGSRTLPGWTVRLDDPPAFRAFARGERVYVCRRRPGEPARFEWILKGQEAQLFDEKGNRMGVESAGSTFQAADGSRVTGQVMEQRRAPSCGAIPWLLFATTSREGHGVFSQVSRIERLYTSGGQASASWHRDVQEGTEVRMKYSATYCFHVARE